MQAVRQWLTSALPLYMQPTVGHVRAVGMSVDIGRVYHEVISIDVVHESVAVIVHAGLAVKLSLVYP